MPLAVVNRCVREQPGVLPGLQPVMVAGRAVLDHDRQIRRSWPAAGRAQHGGVPPELVARSGDGLPCLEPKYERELLQPTGRGGGKGKIVVPSVERGGAPDPAVRHQAGAMTRRIGSVAAGVAAIAVERQMNHKPRVPLRRRSVGRRRNAGQRHSHGDDHGHRHMRMIVCTERKLPVFHRTEAMPRDGGASRGMAGSGRRPVP